ncbi:MAG: hypothetical protein GWO24_07000 [Akkermansiaceae bacterium]|nr:hypothetical protein [Akkermansiaceae bacterium]
MSQARTRKVAATVIVQVALLLGLGLPGHAEDPAYAISLGKPTDEVELTRKGESLELKIKSPAGIGRAKLSLRRKGLKWPESIVLLIRLEDGKPLRELEGFSLQGRSFRVSGSRRTSGKMDAFDLKPEEKKPAVDAGPRKVDVRVAKTREAMRVVIPGALLAGESEVRIQWIDFYR